MGSNDEFGPDTETIRAWLNKRATYAKDARVTASPRGGLATTPAPAPAPPVAEPAAAEPPAPEPPPRRRRPQGPGPDSNQAGRSVLDALGVGAPPEPPSRIAQAGSLDSTDLGRSVVDALRTEPAAAPAPEPASEPAPEPVRPARGFTTTAPPPRTPGPDAQPRRSAPTTRVAAEPATVPQGRWTEPEEHRNALNATTDADFPERSGVRRTMTILLLVVLAGTAAASYAAATAPTTATVGVAATLGFLLLVVWAVRASCTTTKLTIRRGQLTIRRSGHTEVVEVGSPYTPIAIVGEPGHRRWTVLIERDGLPLIVINRSMVDPFWFTTVLYRLRPELRPVDQAAPVRT
ncbi:hypothetical protein ACFJIY_17200 [Pimelobacter simplex]|uniref:hypothetical protein n=1 Tax=Nocardioides simplex TaxID=2045 RepID=UPI0036714CB1